MNPKIKSIIELFQSLPTWEDRYRKIIEIGKNLEAMPDAMKTEDNKVRGCQSQVWLFAEIKDGHVHFWGDSDALIVKGLVSVLLSIYNDLTPKEILATSPEFLKLLGFDTNLSPSRTNGLYAMIKQIQFYALALQMKSGSVT